jgi:hypothetical protein
MSHCEPPGWDYSRARSDSEHREHLEGVAFPSTLTGAARELMLRGIWYGRLWRAGTGRDAAARRRFAVKLVDFAAFLQSIS